MKHVKTLNTKMITEHSKKKVDVVSARHHASQLARHLVQLETRLVSSTNSHR